MADPVLHALKQACHQQILWLNAQAEDYENGMSQHLETRDNIIQDKSIEVAEQFRHQANNLQTVLNAYERLVKAT